MGQLHNKNSLKIHTTMSTLLRRTQNKLLLFALLFVAVPMHANNNDVFRKQFMTCVDRIESYVIRTDNSVTKEQFMLSLDSIARFGIVDETDLLNYSFSYTQPKFQTAKKSWLQWLDSQESDGAQWEDMDQKSLYAQAIEALINAELSDWSAVEGGVKTMNCDTLFVYRMEGLTNYLPSYIADKRLIVVANDFQLNPHVGNFILQVFPLQVTDSGMVYVDIHWGIGNNDAHGRIATPTGRVEFRVEFEFKSGQWQYTMAKKTRAVYKIR